MTMMLTELGVAKQKLDRLRARHYKAANPSYEVSRRETHPQQMDLRNARVAKLYEQVRGAEVEYRRLLDAARLAGF